MKGRPAIAYFSMEVAHANDMPNYAGGLGVLAADMLMSAADQGLEMVGISLTYHKDDNLDYGFNAERYLTLRPETIQVEIEDRSVTIAIWEKQIIGRSGHIVPIYFLSSHVPTNAPWDRDLTKHLYADDRYTRMGQEVILGIGGVRALKALGYDTVDTYHLNEGHAAFATLELLKKYDGNADTVRSMVTFTTHTPIPAGHDYFEYPLASQVMGSMLPANIREYAGDSSLGMTQLALALSKATNSVSKRHQQVCAEMFPNNRFENVTNGVYLPRWAGEHISELLDLRMPGWDENPVLLTDAPKRLQADELAFAHEREKQSLIQWINFNKAFFPTMNVAGEDFLDPDILTIGFSRRTVPYKRPDLILRNIARLKELGSKGLQIIFANRCHPNDQYCAYFRQKLASCAHELHGSVRIVLIPDYDLKIAKRLVTGCDVWLNTPIPPLEASGTSGMKAALNGALNLSMRDGWWIEGAELAPKAGWSFGGERLSDPAVQDERDSSELLDALSQVVETYYEHPEEWAERMKWAVYLAGQFNTTRVLHDYASRVWTSKK